MVRDFTTKHTTAEIVEQAALLRIPVAPVSSGRDVLELDHPRIRGVWLTDPTGRFEMPRRPVPLRRRAGAPAPTHPDDRRPTTASRRRCAGPGPSRRPGRPRCPLEGITVLDLTAWWAGPSGAAVFAALGAEVVHVESTRRIDGMRTAGGMFFSRPQWWEYSAFFLSANTNKYDVTLTLDTPAGSRARPRAGGAGRHRHRELHAPGDRGVRPRLARHPRDQPGRDPRAHAGVRARRTVARPARLRPDHGADHRPGVGHQPPRRPAPHPARARAIPTAGCTPCSPPSSPSSAATAPAQGCLVEAPDVRGRHQRGGRAGHRVERQRRDGRAHGQPQSRRRPAEPVRAPTRRSGGWRCRAAPTSSGGRSPASSATPSWPTSPNWPTLAGRRAAADRLDGLIGAWAAARPVDDAVDELLAAGVPAARGADARAGLHQPADAGPRLLRGRSTTPSSAPIPRRACPSATPASTAGCAARRRRSGSTTSRSSVAGSATPPTSSPPSKPRASSAPGPQGPDHRRTHRPSARTAP